MMKNDNRIWWIGGGAVLLLATALVVLMSKGASPNRQSGATGQTQKQAASTASQPRGASQSEIPGGDRPAQAKSRQGRTPNRPVPSFASIPEPTSTQCLEALATNPRQADRVRAARLLGQRASEEGLAEQAVKALLDAMNDDEKPQVWLVSARSLGNYGPAAAEAVPSLMKWIDHHTMGDVVIEALGKIGSDAKAALVPIAAVAIDNLERPSKRSKALEALVQIGTPDHAGVAAVLKDAAADPDRNIGLAAREAAKAYLTTHEQTAEE